MNRLRQAQAADCFRKLHVRGDPLVLFNVWDAGSAKAVADAGAKAVATSSWTVASANGFADGEQIPFDLAIETLRRIVGAISLPVSIDLESGYGESPELVGETVRAAIEAGAIGCNLEDSVPATGELRGVSDQCSRIRAARESADATGIPFFINARTDLFLTKAPEEHDWSLVALAAARAQAYAEAGADGIFAPGLSNIHLIARLTEASSLPLNIMISGATPRLSDLNAHGVARVSHGPRPYLIAMGALEDAALAATV